ncbi:hypothetical protein PO909_025668 [Leuciscus waleckii]
MPCRSDDAEAGIVRQLVKRIITESLLHFTWKTTNKVLSIVYLGMMVGAFFWGGLADKLGRRQCLLLCMSINGFFAFLSSFVQGYGVFLLCRTIAGLGIGGAVPIVFSYFAEVLAREKRGEHLSWLCMFWMIGEIYASAMAWAIIPHYDGEAQPAAIHISCKAIPLDQAHDEAMLLVECALTPNEHCIPLEVYASAMASTIYLDRLCFDVASPLERPLNETKSCSVCLKTDERDT